MFKVIAITLLLINVSACEESGKIITKLTSNPRQKRLLFYDEEGNLVKTYTNPFLRDFSQVAEKVPFFGNFLNPLFGFLRPTTFSGVATPYMIPVSEAVIQHINSDPLYQNKLVLSPTKEQTIEPNALCEGKRVQIPSPRICSSFLNCWDGWAVEQECPDGLLFSSEGYCDYPRNVDCSMRALREKPQPQPQCRKEFEAFRDEMKCSEFFVCVNKLPIKFKCPADLAFNGELGICDYPNRVNCNAPSDLAPAAPATQTQQSPGFGTFPHPAPEASDEASLDPSSDSSIVTAPILSSPPIAPSLPVAPSPASSSPSFAPGPDPSVIATYPAIISPDPKLVLTKSTGYNTQSWTTTHVAMSRQDAIRQLQLGRIANVNAA